MLSSPSTVARSFFLFFSIIISAQSHADNPAFYTIAQLSIGRVTVDSDFSFESDGASSLTTGYGLKLGAQYHDVILEASYNNNNANSVFGMADSYDIDLTQVVLGYSLFLGSRYVLTPKVGQMKWRIRAREGLLFNPGEEAKATTSGYDAVYAVEFRKRSDTRLSMGMEFIWGETDYGKATFLGLVGKFQF